MRFYELLKECSSNFVASKVVELYNDEDERQFGAYENFYNYLLGLTPTIDDTYEIHVYEYESIFDSTEIYTNVSAWNIEEEQYYAISFMPRKEILGMRIEEDSFQEYEKHELLAHILWEISYDGFTQEQVDKKLNHLQSLVENIHNEKS